MNNLIALVFTFVVNGEMHQTTPGVFFTMADCKKVIEENKLPTESFKCEYIKDEK